MSSGLGWGDQDSQSEYYKDLTPILYNGFWLVLLILNSFKVQDWFL